LLSTSINQLSRIIYGLVLVICVPLYLSPEIQGYWFTLMSLAFLMVFADLGFSAITMNYAAHEYAYLNIKGNVISGDELHLKRLASFFQFTLKWVVNTLCIMGPLIVIVSYFLLNKKGATEIWLLPWVIYLISSMLTFINNVLLFFFEGCDQIDVGQKIRALIFFISAIGSIIALSAGWQLMALACPSLLGAIIGFSLINFKYRAIIKKLLLEAKGFKQNWFKEFFPLWWRYSISWISGYFIFQIFTPITFNYFGPIAAGKVGLTMTLWQGIYSVATIWVSSVVPRINMHISRREWDHLDKTFYRRTLLAGGTYFLISLPIIVGFAFGFNYKIALFQRFLSAPAMIMLSIACFFQLIVNAMATYLRAHKQEPLMLISVLSAFYIVLVTCLCVKYLPIQYIFFGFLSSNLWSFPWIYIVFKNIKNKH